MFLERAVDHFVSPHCSTPPSLYVHEYNNIRFYNLTLLIRGKTVYGKNSKLSPGDFCCGNRGIMSGMSESYVVFYGCFHESLGVFVVMIFLRALNPCLHTARKLITEGLAVIINEIALYIGD